MKSYKIIFAAIILTLSGIASAINFFATSNYYQGNYQNMDPTYGGICIGGDICGLENTLFIVYPQNTYLSVAEVTAHDDVGSKTKARLQLWVDGVFQEDMDVKKAGSTLRFYINKTVKGNIEFRSVGESDGKTDETVIESVLTF
ncbi:MAG: hypothetical protein ACPGUE_16555 [Marinomonas sp.]|uniref:hypothetical protein n=1 Tax=unclassified Marinomonas TaxID=196814 RepID=UPI0005F9D7BA|nr:MULTISPECIES: hypothetical protein [unclassified Marinomonas]KJZ13751.1 hypothetical protein TW85_11145 [Marinomonas sp. S3726]KZM44924.1 hypothetical protein OA92_03440 [Marinomonas sp. SBI22]KZM46623.1 hypothetical protein OA91_02500 [Marinomonas sp. SBI8L]